MIPPLVAQNFGLLDKGITQKASHHNGLSPEAFIRLLDNGGDGGEQAIEALVEWILSTRNIHQDPDICSGDPVLRGTRIRAGIIGRMALDNFQETQKDYPHLSNQQLASAMAWYCFEKIKST